MFVNPSLLEIEFRRVCIFAFTFIMAKALVKPVMVSYLKCSYLLRLTVAFTPAVQVTSCPDEGSWPRQRLRNEEDCYPVSEGLIELYQNYFVPACYRVARTNLFVRVIYSKSVCVFKQHGQTSLSMPPCLQPEI